MVRQVENGANVVQPKCVCAENRCARAAQLVLGKGQTARRRKGGDAGSQPAISEATRAVEDVQSVHHLSRASIRTLHGAPRQGILAIPHHHGKVRLVFVTWQLEEMAVRASDVFTFACHVVPSNPDHHLAIELELAVAVCEEFVPGPQEREDLLLGDFRGQVTLTPNGLGREGGALGLGFFELLLGHSLGRVHLLGGFYVLVRDAKHEDGPQIQTGVSSLWVSYGVQVHGQHGLLITEVQDQLRVLTSHGSQSTGGGPSDLEYGPHHAFRAPERKHGRLSASQLVVVDKVPRHQLRQDERRGHESAPHCRRHEGKQGSGFPGGIVRQRDF
mmetsp:Transcript_43897/g.90638  ORF Transcript_43897/g.90638 Transcript_43897/m.90638 type:complete len:330 (+) Transcript_43897:624-1613(+)